MSISGRPAHRIIEKETPWFRSSSGSAHWPPVSREEARRRADWARNLHLAAEQAHGVRVYFPEGRAEDLAEVLRQLARNLER